MSFHLFPSLRSSSLLTSLFLSEFCRFLFLSRKLFLIPPLTCSCHANLPAPCLFWHFSPCVVLVMCVSPYQSVESLRAGTVSSSSAHGWRPLCQGLCRTPVTLRGARPSDRHETHKLTNIQNVIMNGLHNRVTLELRLKGRAGVSCRSPGKSSPGKGAESVKAQLPEGAEGI